MYPMDPEAFFGLHNTHAAELRRVARQAVLARQAREDRPRSPARWWPWRRRKAGGHRATQRARHA